MKPSYHQFNCRETKELDLRQADAVLKYQPDIIIMEYPNNILTPNLEVNNYPALKKPIRLVKKLTKEFSQKVLKIHPWARADTVMWKNIASLWKKGHQVLVYSVDAPSELTGEWLEVWQHMYPSALNNWIWWVKIYLREKIMLQNIQWVLSNYQKKKDPKILIFLQSFHWQHVRFLMSYPSNNEIWHYYFGNFSEIDTGNIGPKLKKINKVFYKYWKQISDF